MNDDVITVREMVGREIIYCVSQVVDNLSTLMQSADRNTLNTIGYDWEDDILPLLESTDYEEAARNHIDDMERDALLEALDNACIEDGRNQHQIAEAASRYAMENDLAIEDWGAWWEDFMGVPDEQLRILLLDDLVNGADDSWEEFCQQYDVDTDDHKREVYEHWLVSDWLGNKLRGKGETVGELMGMTIWGRCTTGQSISMDYVIGQIYKELTGKEVTSADY
jgi:hypothetical protein